MRYEGSIGCLAIKAEQSQFNSVSVTFVSLILPIILLHIHEWNTWVMGFRMEFRCWWASPEIKFQKPSNMPSGTSTFSGAPFGNQVALAEFPPNEMINLAPPHQE
jgi:hypothetical protein